VSFILTPNVIAMHIGLHYKPQRVK